MKHNRDILFMQETERKRIAEELHNNTVQDMVCLYQKLELALLYMEEDLVQSRLELITAKRRVQFIIDGIRDTIYNLRPMTLDDIGYDAAFRVLYDKLQKSGLDVAFDIDRISMEDGVTAVSVYHLVNEACQNVMKHAHANRISVSVKCGAEQIFVSIADNGVGFCNRSGSNHFGLSFMKERVDLLEGDMEILSDGGGTTVRIKVPMVRSENGMEKCLND